jgi:hypothetical protein
MGQTCDTATPILLCLSVDETQPPGVVEKGVLTEGFVKIEISRDPSTTDDS